MPFSNSEMTKKLRDIFYRPGLTIVPGGTTPYHAMMVQAAGYDAFYMSGGMTSGWLVGWPDVGVTTMREMADNISRIAKVVNIPVFADVDVGYGTAVNVYRTTKDYIWAGAAGFHLEDQEFPKKSGSMAGRRLVTIEEAVGKYKAAIEARNEIDRNFVICARTDARGAEGGGFQEVLKRAKAYEQAGVDVLFFESLQSWEECKTALKSVKIPAFCLLHEVIYRNEDGTARPGPSLKEQEAGGQKIALHVGLGIQAGSQATWEMLLDFKDRGMDALHDWRSAQDKKPQAKRMPAISSMTTAQVRALEEKFLPKDLQRDYEHTLGAHPGGGLNRPGGGRMA